MTSHTDADTNTDMLVAEGYEFEFAPEKVTLNVDDLKARLALQAN